MSAKQRFTTIWLILLLNSLLLFSVAITSTISKVQYKPIAAEALTPPAGSIKNPLRLYDGVEITQSFPAPVRQISHIAVGISNLNTAPKTALIKAALTSQTDQRQIFSTSFPVSTIPADDLTVLSLPARLITGNDYEIKISTQGINKNNFLSIHYESSVESYPEGYLAIKTSPSATVKPKDGNIHLQILTHPTKRVILSNLLDSSLFYVSLTLLLLLTMLWLPKPRHYLTYLLSDNQNINKKTPKLPIKEVVLAGVISLSISLAVTWPYYTCINCTDTMGDVQRMLIYRGLGRQSLLENGQTALWDPYTCGGMPLIGNIESAHLDPFFFLFVTPFGENLGLRLSATAAIAIGFAGAYILARRFARTKPLPALLAGTIFTLTGFQMLAFSTGVFPWLPIGLVPWFIFFLLASLDKPIHFSSAGLILGFIILGGNPHMPVFAALLGFFLTITISLQNKSWRPLLLLLLSCTVASAISAVKLLPSAEFLSLFDNFNRPSAYIPPLNWLPKMFFDRQQMNTPLWLDTETGIPHRWPDYASYVGFLPVLLTLIATPWLIRKKHALPWLVSALAFLSMTFGYFPWNILYRLPVMGEIVRTATRSRSMFFLALGILAAISISLLAQRISPKKKTQTVLASIILMAIFADLYSLHAPLFPGLFDQQLPTIEKQTSFKRILHGYTDNDTKYYHASYVNYLSNEGTTDLCNPMLATNYDLASTSENSSDPEKQYLGEAYLLASGKTAHIKSLTPNTINVSLDTNQDDWLLLNQNYFPGWRTFPARPVTSKNGLIAARITQEDTSIIFTYNPLSYRIGKYITFIGLTLLAWLAWTQYSNKTKRIQILHENT